MSGKSIKVQLIGLGTDGAFRAAKVNGEGELTFVEHTHPPIDEDVSSFPFNQFFTRTGEADGDNDMAINPGVGAFTDYYIPAQQDVDTYIKTVEIYLSDTSITRLDRFGDLTALTNGVKFSWQSTDLGEIIIDEGIKDNQRWFRLAIGPPDIINVAGGGSDDGIFPDIDLAYRFGGKWGIRLRKNTNDRLIFRVQDNLSGLTTFNARGHGRKI